MVVLQHLAHIPAAAEALAGDPRSFKTLLAIATSPEQQDSTIAAISLSTEDLDYELKLLAWASLGAAAAAGEVIPGGRAAGPGRKPAAAPAAAEGDTEAAEASAASTAAAVMVDAEDVEGGVVAAAAAGAGDALGGAPAVRMVRESGLMNVLLQYISPGESGQYIRGRWNKEQQQVLQRHALTCLCQVGGLWEGQRGGCLERGRGWEKAQEEGEE